MGDAGDFVPRSPFGNSQSETDPERDRFLYDFTSIRGFIGFRYFALHMQNISGEIWLKFTTGAE